MSQTSATRDSRLKMVDVQLARRGISDAKVLDAMRHVPREKFIDPPYVAHAYEDRPLPIGAGQTISQPYIVAYMIAALQLTGGETVLEIGGGSGYAAAVLARIVSHVYAIERIPELAARARDNLVAAGVENVTIRCADGTEGWPEEAPFDAILVSAGAPGVPQTLMEQLQDGGRMVVPVGSDPASQDLIRVVRRNANTYDRECLTSVRFVPLIGIHGWKPDST